MHVVSSFFFCLENFKCSSLSLLTSLTLTDNPQFLWLKSVFKEYFDAWFVLFKQQDGNFSKTEKKSCHRKHVNGLKLQPIQLLEAVVSTSTSSQIHFDCIVDNPSLLALPPFH